MIAQALASLEGQVKGTVTDFVVKVCAVIFNLYVPINYVYCIRLAHRIARMVGAHIEAEPVGVCAQ